ncbi:MAG: hypothetical protein Q9168_003150 [Polycauliona sp. 1 TL-2023]
MKDPVGSTLRRMLDLTSRAPSFIRTLYLFGKSDIPVAAIPTIAIALVLAGPSELSLVLKGIIWNQLHLLTFQVKNQINGVEEDRVAKPHRPLPSRRMSTGEAAVLYYALFALMWAAALYTKTILCTLTYSVAIVIYNEGGLAAVPVLKNLIGALGLACYCWGTTVILGKIHFARYYAISPDHADMLQDHGNELQGMKAVAVILVGAIFATTVSPHFEIILPIDVLIRGFAV